MTDQINPRTLETLLDREAIRECLFLYCRGIDRLDEAALRASYWPDATDNHGPYKGSATGFIDWAVEKLKDSGRLVHMLGNISIVLRGPAAAVESYFQAFQADKTASGDVRETFLCGRYIDRFEKRSDEWRVAQRVVTYDWISVNERADGTDAERFGVRQPVGGRKTDDPYYALLAQAPFSN